MKNILLTLLILGLAAGLFPQCQNSILGETEINACAVKPLIYGVRNLWTTAGGSYKHVWALHNADGARAIDKAPSATNPVATFTTNAGWGCGSANLRCIQMQGDDCGNFDTAAVDHCKFVYLFEQNKLDAQPQFAVLVFGENAGNTLQMETVQTNINTAGRGCNATMTPVIGTISATNPNQPAIDSYLLDTPVGSTTITLSWALPNGEGIMFTKDTEDTLTCGQAYGFNPADRAAAMAELITGWEIFYAYTNATPAAGLRAGWTAVNDTDATRVQVGGVWYSTNEAATVVVPNSGTNGILLSVSPIFDGAAGSPGRAILGTKSVRLAGVTSLASDPVDPTPVSFASFTGRYEDLQTVSLAWETSSETDAMGFNVYRSLDGATWTKANSALIPAKGQGGAGASYAFTDQLPKQRVYQKWQYRVEELSNEGLRVAEANTTVTK